MANANDISHDKSCYNVNEAAPELDEYEIGAEEDSPVGGTYYHVNEGYNVSVRGDLNTINTIIFIPHENAIEEGYEDEDDIADFEPYYEIEALDNQYDTVLCADLTLSELYDYFPQSIVNDIVERDESNNTRLSSKDRNEYRIEDILYRDTTPSDINDVDEVNRIAKKIQTGGESGYLLTDGDIIYFHDHIQINSIDGMTPDKFMALGNIRLGASGGFELIKKPTREQMYMLRQWIRRQNGTIHVDFCEESNKTYPRHLFSTKYTSSNPERIINDLYYYFEEGIKPQDNFYEEKMKNNKLIHINENKLCLITESQESKSIAQAKRLVMQRLGYNEQDADEFVRIKLRGDIPSLRGAEGGKFILGVTRMYCDGELRDAETIGNLNKIIKIVSSESHINEYDRNLNGLSAQEFISQFEDTMGEMLNADKNELSSMEFMANNDYEIVRIDSFEDAEEYGDYTSWCITHDEDMYDSYSNYQYNQFYFCLRRGFKDVPQEQGDGCPLDEYGLSMIAVSVDGNGGLNTCTCRWNHNNDGNDNIMDTKQISSLIGRNFYDVFKPNKRWEKLIEWVKELFANGVRPEEIFDSVEEPSCGFMLVELNDKFNFINNKGDFLTNKWYDYAYEFNDGFACIRLHEKWNLINTEGRIVSNKWFDEVDYFYDGFAKVELGDKVNFIDANGQFIGNQWYDYANCFKNGFASVKLNDKYNFINTSGEIVSKNWFDRALYFSDGFGKVRINGKWNFIDTEGNYLCSQWFDSVGDFCEGFAQVVLNGKHNFINTEGNYLCSQWFDSVGDFYEGVAYVKLNNKYNFINRKGMLFCNQWYDDIVYYGKDFVIVKIFGEPNKKINFEKFVNESGNRMNKLIHINENKLSLITESQESKSIAAAKKLVMQRLGYNEQDADEFVRIKLRGDIPSLRGAEGGKFILGVTRMYCDGELRDAETIGKLNKTLKLVSSKEYINEYDRNLNGLSAEELISKFKDTLDNILGIDRNELSSMELMTNNDYEIVRIDSFEDANKYGAYTSWCITHDPYMFDEYTNEGANQFYFCLRHGFENVPREKGENCPLDEYGLSMIAVSVDGNGSLNTCTCRWNHDNGGDDDIMDTKEISSLIGRNFYDVFKPNNNWEELMASVKEGIANGVDLGQIFDGVGEPSNGFRLVKLKRKFNFIDDEGNFLSDKWFLEAGGFNCGVAPIELKEGMWNYITKDGNLLVPGVWFNYCYMFARDEISGFECGWVHYNDKWNYVTKNGEILCKDGFDGLDNFIDGYARVRVDERYNFINTKGEIISKDRWFNFCMAFKEGFGRIELNSEKQCNYINGNGELLRPDIFFEWCGEFTNGVAPVKIDDNYYYITKDGQINDVYVTR